MKTLLTLMAIILFIALNILTAGLGLMGYIIPMLLTFSVSMALVIMTYRVVSL